MISRFKKLSGFVKKILIISLCTMAIILMIITIKQSKQVKKSEVFFMPVKVVKPYSGTLDKDYRITGYIESESMVTILPRISGTLTAINVDVGESVKKNSAILAMIDQEPYKLSLEQAKVAFLSSKTTYDRILSLYNANATSLQNYEQAKSQYDVYKAQYDLAMINFSYTQVKSPIDGVVLSKHASVGDLVAPQIPIITIGNIDKLMVKAGIPEKYYYFFMKNEGKISIKVTIPALNNQVISANIKTISPYISPKSKSFEISCEITKQVNGLRPGMFCYISVVLDSKKNIYFLPYDTLVLRKYLWYVKDGVANQMEYDVNFYNDKYFEVPKEYADYEFVYDGQHFLTPQQPVKVIDRKEN